jgi:hypothetical protein
MSSPFVPERYNAITSGTIQTFLPPTGENMAPIIAGISVIVNEHTLGLSGVTNTANLGIGFAAQYVAYPYESVAMGLGEKHNTVAGIAYSRAANNSYIHLPKANNGQVKADASIAWTGPTTFSVNWNDLPPNDLNIINTFVGGPQISQAEVTVVEPDHLSGTIHVPLNIRPDQVFFICERQTFVSSGEVDDDAAFSFGSASFHYSGQTGNPAKYPHFFEEDVVDQGSVNWFSNNGQSPQLASKVQANISDEYIYVGDYGVGPNVGPRIAAEAHAEYVDGFDLRTDGDNLHASGELSIGVLAIEYAGLFSGAPEMSYDTAVVQAPAFGATTWEPLAKHYDSYIVSTTLLQSKNTHITNQDECGTVGIGFTNRYNTDDPGRAMSAAVSYATSSLSGLTTKTDTQTAFSTERLTVPLGDGSEGYELTYAGAGVFNVLANPTLSGEVAPYWLAIGAGPG